MNKDKLKRIVLKFAIGALFIFLSLSAYVIYSLNSPYYNSCGENVPVESRIEFQKIGEVVNCNFEVREPHSYLLTLHFLRDDQKLKIGDYRNAVFRRVEGDNKIIPNYLGAPVSFEIIISDEKSGMMHSEIINNPKESSFGDKSIKANLSRVGLYPGKYNLRIKNLKVAEELSHITSTVVIKYDLAK